MATDTLARERADKALAHHFDDLDQQQSCATLGMWIFLVTEILFFGGLWTAYAVYRNEYAAAFAACSRELDVVLGTLNTVVLLTSSFTVAMAVHHARYGRPLAIARYLAATVAMALAFLAVKGVEWHGKIASGHLPGPGFVFFGPSPGDGARETHAELFFVLYYLMTGMHALHVAIGVFVLAFLAWRATRGVYTPRYHAPLEVAGLYWHFVDIVWIFLFPLFYLLDRAG